MDVAITVVQVMAVLSTVIYFVGTIGGSRRLKIVGLIGLSIPLSFIGWLTLFLSIATGHKILLITSIATFMLFIPFAVVAKKDIEEFKTM